MDIYRDIICSCDCIIRVLFSVGGNTWNHLKDCGIFNLPAQMPYLCLGTEYGTHTLTNALHGKLGSRRGYHDERQVLIV